MSIIMPLKPRGSRYLTYSCISTSTDLVIIGRQSTANSPRSCSHPTNCAHRCLMQHPITQHFPILGIPSSEHLKCALGLRSLIEGATPSDLEHESTSKRAQSAPDPQSNRAHFRQYAGISERYPGYQEAKCLYASMLAHNRPGIVPDCRVVSS